MADLNLQERLQPSLLDRLTDEEPDKKVESRDQRVIPLAKLRAYVLRDLTWLLNSTQISASEDLTDYPLVAKSVLNYGLPAFSGTSLEQIGIATAEQAIIAAIGNYEPRLLPSSLTVKLLKESQRDDSHNTIAFEIEAVLWAQPIPHRMYMKTELDLEIGYVRVTEEAEAPRPETRRR